MLNFKTRNDANFDNMIIQITDKNDINFISFYLGQIYVNEQVTEC